MHQLHVWYLYPPPGMLDPMARAIGEITVIGNDRFDPTAIKTETWCALVDFRNKAKFIRSGEEYLGSARPCKDCPIWVAFERAMGTWRDYYDDPRWGQKYNCAPAIEWDFENVVDDMKDCRDSVRYKVEWHRKDRLTLAPRLLKLTSFTARVRRDRGIINTQIQHKLREQWGWLEHNNLPGCPGYLVSLAASRFEDENTRSAAERSYFLRKARRYRFDTLVGRLPPWPYGYDQSRDE